MLLANCTKLRFTNLVCIIVLYCIVLVDPQICGVAQFSVNVDIQMCDKLAISKVCSGSLPKFNRLLSGHNLLTPKFHENQSITFCIILLTNKWGETIICAKNVTDVVMCVSLELKERSSILALWIWKKLLIEFREK